MTISLRPHVFEARDGRSIAAEMGSLTVPMNRSAPGRGTVALAFVRLPSTSAKPGPPVIFLNGGPGLSGIRAGRGRLFALFDALRAAGDVILLDQRGAGSSTPSLDCAQMQIALDVVVDRSDRLHLARVWMRQCAEQLAHAGVDVRAFNTNESADDVADLVRALGTSTASLLGWSYGTHLAFAVMRRHGDLVARAVLAGPEGPDHTYKLPSRIEQYLSAISARARAQMPNAPELVDSMTRVFAGLAEIEIIAANETPAAPFFTRFDVEWMTAEGIADPRMIARLPRWYARMARGRFVDIAHDPVLRAYFEASRNQFAGTLARVCMDCASGASRERWSRIEKEAEETLLGRTIDFPLPEICDAIGMPDLGDEFRAPLRSATPVLFVTGTLDARTPAENAHELIPGFSNSRHLVVEDAGHTDLLDSPRVRDAVARFMRGEDVASQQLPAERPLQFERPTPVLLYDDQCAFCRRQVDGLRRRVGDAVEFESYRTGAQWSSIPEAELAQSVHFIDGDTVASGAEAVFLTLAAGGKHRALLWLYRRVRFFAQTAEASYRWVARNRARLGRKLR
ncbi:MAG TPA: alpha/beta fold hydrolase [Candidatus Krumholzibacteria bacterium]|nr:alpha/beta fold hydrolase [Candidatus Krumholzibacteria bacterium]